MNSAWMRLFASSPRGVEPLLADEVRLAGARRVRPLTGGVSFEGDLAVIGRVCLYSRVASRLLLPLARVPADGLEGFDQALREIPWEDHLRADGTLAVDFSGTNAIIRHTRFGAMKVKDAVVDRLRERGGIRPSVDFDRPDLRIHARLSEDRGVDIGIDLSGEALHRRGYRVNAGSAPLKENLAAAILLLAGWPEIARRGGMLLDPMCGSGTFLIEAAWMAGDIAPGLARGHFGFLGWSGHDPAVWQPILAEARERARAGRSAIPTLLGFEPDAKTLEAAQENVVQAGVADRIALASGNLERLERPIGVAGLMVVNPPYGERQGEVERLEQPIYRLLGQRWRTRLAGWKGAVLTASPRLADALGEKPTASKSLYNGPIACRLLLFDAITPARVERDTGGSRPDDQSPGDDLPPTPGDPDAPGAVMFANRLKKNRRRLDPWLKRESVSCYRLYDADIPEYAVAVDRYGPWIHLQEYRPPAGIDPEAARRRLGEVLAVLPRALGVDPDKIHLKTRHRQSAGSGGQYGRLGEGREWAEVDEGGLKLLVNFTDTLDVGLFLDHAPLRRMIRSAASGKRFLNLFGYTGSATVHAAAGGARSTLTVDLSRHYLEWAGRNLAANGFTGLDHRLVRADCLEWLAQVAESGDEGKFDLILLDPPTFSNSARMQRPFELQREHPALITQATRLLAPGGVLYFSNNARRFHLDADALPAGLHIEEITRQTIGPDFANHPPTHHCWRFTWLM
ncbi:MAG: bifunctional 23S rRNA (guanine(2069)-N(7))-methyltransferase RlmK/23S rRNA (guanine(2445)-N(2))-methyltransferase RlmL [Magnetococcales bacterium]|nr:bifunctional 23S rRNA (guanine(2069)-N(7))-methyltransferase RlmK/23S rRNA (guanine(2445)-N(2))-methyltransferase RlmL [Magnetococcales bacterium]